MVLPNYIVQGIADRVAIQSFKNKITPEFSDELRNIVIEAIKEYESDAE